MKIIIYDDRKRDRSALKKILADYKQNHHQDLEILEYEDIGNEANEDNLLEFSFVEGKMRISVEDIVYIETSRHKNYFYTDDGVYSIYRKLGELEEELSEYGFLRVHLSFLVNMRYIDKISSYVLTLKNGKELSVPKSRYREVKKQYANHLDLLGKWCSPD